MNQTGAREYVNTLFQLQHHAHSSLSLVDNAAREKSSHAIRLKCEKCVIHLTQPG